MNNNRESSAPLPEVWLRGAIEGVPSLLQPVAHALLQAAEEVNRIMQGFPNERLWERPAGAASAAFHLQHVPGVLDRLFTYARGAQLSMEQMKYLSEEGMEADKITTDKLLTAFAEQVNRSIEYLRSVDAAALTEPRFVGRRKLPSTVMGLLFHSAEHTMRHIGQLLVTVRVVTAAGNA